MCNIWTNEHTFIWMSSSTTNAEPPAKLICKCGAYHYDGTFANITTSISIHNDIYKELRIVEKKL